MKIVFAVIGLVLALGGFALLVENLGSIRLAMQNPAAVDDMGFRIVVAVTAGAAMVTGAIFLTTAGIMHRRS